MAQTVIADLSDNKIEEQVENKKSKKVNNSNIQWSSIKSNKTVEEQMEYTLVKDNGKLKGVIQSKNPTNIY
ncbi:hypothetical protein [Spiroplasma melliferum]|uniref:Uncharacterized protein n=2 Tax=Spiroplasma melliferum TaxID=2134 RepID=A0AAI9X1P7_SPIME|nr:hypothetical protein [Spiroplasma melliferum]KAI93159.1 hypothetical protein SPM_002830 [Spiroplasma melliferum KC3]QCO23898.1 hypothetical protein SRED_002378 [Spiroplasma melliferum]